MLSSVVIVQEKSPGTIETLADPATSIERKSETSRSSVVTLPDPFVIGCCMPLMVIFEEFFPLSVVMTVVVVDCFGWASSQPPARSTPKQPSNNGVETREHRKQYDIATTQFENEITDLNAPSCKQIYMLVFALQVRMFQTSCEEIV